MSNNILKRQNEIIKKNEIIKNNEIIKKVNGYFNNSLFLHTLVLIDSFPHVQNAESELLLRIAIYCNEYNIDFIKINKNGIVLPGHLLTGINIDNFSLWRSDS